MAANMPYIMAEVIESCLMKFSELVVPGTTIKPCPIPCSVEDHRESPAAALWLGLVVLCRWCRRTNPLKQLMLADVRQDSDQEVAPY